MVSPPVSVSSSSSVVAGKYSPPSSATSSPVSNQSVVNPHYQHLLHNNQISSLSVPMGFPNFHPQVVPHGYNYCPRCIPPHQGSPRQVYLVHNGNHWQY
ncbi:hypothetical protein C5167_047435 [Papaver somniferum]|uniref:Uncharacterized protein n=1 Tax=Papaver somniferum TaxID=3469 RepID=A0A4Y7LKE9_PAPSO|nr:hypothetical protein C5167_047435 [Papaver somniferum]